MAERTDRGLTPVIGVVLLIGLTVILAATLATLALAIDTPTEPSFEQSLETDTTDTPTASFSFSASRGRITVTHDGGDVLTAQKVTIETGEDTQRWGDSGDVREGDSRTVAASGGVVVAYQGEVVAEYTR